MADDVKDWLSQCVACIKRKSPVGRHHPLGHIPTGHRWDRIAMDILDVCDPTPEGFRYILVIADYFSKWTEAFPMKNKCADTVADILVEKIILRFGMPLVIHSDQGREFENGLMKSLCALLGCTKTRTAPYQPLVLRMSPAPWHGVVRRPAVLRSAPARDPVAVDGYGSGSPVWPGAAQLLYYYQQPRVCAVAPFLQGGGGWVTARFRSIDHDVSSTKVAHYPDAGCGGGL